MGDQHGRRECGRDVNGRSFDTIAIFFFKYATIAHRLQAKNWRKRVRLLCVTSRNPNSNTQTTKTEMLHRVDSQSTILMLKLRTQSTAVHAVHFQFSRRGPHRLSQVQWYKNHNVEQRLFTREIRNSLDNQPVSTHGNMSTALSSSHRTVSSDWPGFGVHQ